MRIYRFLTRNSMGFRHKIWGLALVCVLLSILCGNILVPILEEPLYERYLASAEVLPDNGAERDDEGLSQAPVSEDVIREEFSARLTTGVRVVSFVVLFLLLRTLSVRMGWAAALFRHRSDLMMPHNDLELWCSSVYGTWAHFAWPAEGWPLVGGMHRTPVKIMLCKKSVSSMWGGR